MAISLNITPEMQPISRNNRQINILIEAVADAGENIKSIAISSSNLDPNISIITQKDIPSIQLIGTYSDPFSDSFVYVDKGSSDKIQTPQIAYSLNSMPLKKDFFRLNQDTNKSVTKHYDITVNTDTDSFLFNLTQEIDNEWNAMYSFVKGYYK